MARLDVFVQHMAKLSASGVELVSGQPAKFLFPTGPRATKQVLKHDELIRIADESGPAGSQQKVEAEGRTEFPFNTADGHEFDVTIESLNQQTWRLVLHPSAGKGKKPAAQASPKVNGNPAAPTLVGAAAPQASPAPTASAAAAPAPEVAAPVPEKKPPPKIEVVPGEPALNRLLRVMYAKKASDLHLSSTMPPLIREHGEMTPLEDSMPALSHEELKQILIEVLPDRNRREFEEVWDTDFAHEIKGLSRFRANIFMDRNGIGAVFRVIPFEILGVDKLGLPQQVLNLCWLSKGLVLVTGPTGSGKSTTLAGLINFINENRSDHIITIEDPVEFVHPNKKCLVNQREIGVHTKSFKSALRAALREDPDIVLVGEMRDLETIAIAIETAETGHLVFGTLHTTSAISTIDRIIDQFPADRQSQIRVMLSESFKGAISQVLCKKIGGGRIGAYDILLSTPACANLIREGKTFQIKTVMQTGKNLGMQTMNDHILDMVRNKKVEPEEGFIKTNDKQIFKEELEKMGIKLNLKTTY